MRVSSALACALLAACGSLPAASASGGAASGHAEPSSAAAGPQLASAAEPKLKWKPYRAHQEPGTAAQAKTAATKSTFAEKPAAEESGVKQASALKEAECETTVDGKVEQCAARSKPVARKTEPTLAKKPTQRSAVAKSRLAAVKTAAAYQDDESSVDPLADPLADPFGEQAPPRSRRQQIDETLDETETVTPSEEPETSSMPDELEAPTAPSRVAPRSTPRQPRALPQDDPFPSDALPNQQKLMNPDGIPTTSDVNCEQDKEVCRQDFLALKANVISRIDLDIAIAGAEGTDFPCECSPSGLSVFEPRNWSQTVYTWKASGLCHKPLYFEDVHLERYGHSWNPVVQPFLSGAHFFVTVPLLPYKMGMNPPNECIYTLGYYRPGNCAPYLIDPIPLSLRGAIYQGAVVTGAFYIFP